MRCPPNHECKENQFNTSNQCRLVSKKLNPLIWRSRPSTCNAICNSYNTSEEDIRSSYTFKQLQLPGPGPPGRLHHRGRGRRSSLRWCTHEICGPGGRIYSRFCPRCSASPRWGQGSLARYDPGKRQWTLRRSWTYVPISHTRNISLTALGSLSHNGLVLRTCSRWQRGFVPSLQQSLHGSHQNHHEEQMFPDRRQRPPETQEMGIAADDWLANGL